MKRILHQGARSAMLSTWAVAAALVSQSCSSDSESNAAYEARSQDAANAADEMSHEAKRIGDEFRSEAEEFSAEVQEQAAAAREEIESSVQQAADAIDDSNADDALEALKRELGGG